MKEKLKKLIVVFVLILVAIVIALWLYLISRAGKMYTPYE